MSAHADGDAVGAADVVEVDVERAALAARELVEHAAQARELAAVGAAAEADLGAVVSPR
jgi:hypothetical protein